MNYMMSHQAIMQKNKLLLKRVLPSLLYRRREQFATNDIILYVFFFLFFFLVIIYPWSDVWQGTPGVDAFVS